MATEILAPKRRICDDHLEMRYLIDLPELDILFHEIPKNASSAAKHFFLTSNRGIPSHVQFGLGHKTWFHLFPECRVPPTASIPKRQHSIFIFRDPVSRIKSAYLNIYKQRLKHTEGFKHFLTLDLPVFLASGNENTVLNHFKPQHWFLPEDILEQRNVVPIPIHDASKLKEFVEAKLGRPVAGVFRSMNQSSPSGNLIELSDHDIQLALKSMIPDEFDFYDAASQMCRSAND